MIYLWLKAGHILFVIFWMAGLFMLPRLFIYHQEAEPDSQEAARYVERERRLTRIILTPSIIMVWVLGLALALATQAFSEGWFHAKLLLVLGLSGYHGWLSSYARSLARGDYRLNSNRLRLLNEIPGIVAVLVVVLVVVKPF